jgi:hypothetical protein
MNMCIRGAGILLLLSGLTVAAPGYAVAEPPVPKSDAVLYETTENMSIRALHGGRRQATSALLGRALRGTALCPEHLVEVVEPLAKYCTLNATGSDNISLTTGLGQFGGQVTVVVQEVNPLTGNPTPDSPEVVVARGRFTGRMDFSPAIVGVPDGHGGFMQLPLGTVVGHLSLDGFSKRVPFTGVFRLPFLNGETPLYLLDPETFVVEPVAPNEMAIGYPAVRFEISF